MAQTFEEWLSQAEKSWLDSEHNMLTPNGEELLCARLAAKQAWHARDAEIAEVKFERTEYLKAVESVTEKLIEAEAKIAEVKAAAEEAALRRAAALCREQATTEKGDYQFRRGVLTCEKVILALIPEGHHLDRLLAARDQESHQRGFDAGFDGAERAAFEREQKYVAEWADRVVEAEANVHQFYQTGRVYTEWRAGIDRMYGEKLADKVREAKREMREAAAQIAYTKRHWLHAERVETFDGEEIPEAETPWGAILALPLDARDSGEGAK